MFPLEQSPQVVEHGKFCRDSRSIYQHERIRMYERISGVAQMAGLNKYCVGSRETLSGILRLDDATERGVRHTHGRRRTMKIVAHVDETSLAWGKKKKKGEGNEGGGQRDRHRET